MRAAIGGAIRALDPCWFATPDGAGALCAAEQILLVVGGAKDVIPNEAEQQDGEGVGIGELDWVVHQVQTLKRNNHLIIKIRV